MADDDQPRLHAVTLGQGHHALGKRADELKLDNLRCSVSAIRHRGIGGSVNVNALLMECDVVVLMGTPAALEAREKKLLTAK